MVTETRTGGAALVRILDAAAGTLDEIVVRRLRRLEAEQDELFAHLKALQRKIKAGRDAT